MDYDELIRDFKESESTASPLWIWFAKKEKSATCTMCNTSIPQKDSTMGGMVNHQIAEGENYLTLSSIITVLTILHDKTRGIYI